MTLEDLWPTLLTSTVVAALVSALVGFWTAVRNIKHKAVTEERQRRREAMRELVPTFVAETKRSTRRTTRDSLVLRLNPKDDADAVHLLDRCLVDPSNANQAAVVDHFASMLKLDWERAKIEASMVPWHATRRAKRRVDRQQRRPEAPNRTSD